MEAGVALPRQLVRHDEPIVPQLICFRFARYFTPIAARLHAGLTEQESPKPRGTKPPGSAYRSLDHPAGGVSHESP